jgi:hypothetical protein
MSAAQFFQLFRLFASSSTVLPEEARAGIRPIEVLEWNS